MPHWSTALPNTYLQQVTAGVVGALAVALLALLRRWKGRVKRLEARSAELSLAVMLKTREIRREKETIAKQKQQIEELLVRAQESNRAKDRFLANISHEIRTPLHGVIGLTHVLLDGNLDSEQRDHLQLIDSSARSLLSMLSDVLDFSKMEAGALTFERVRFPLRQCVEEASGGFAAAARVKGLAFLVHIDSRVPDAIEGDPLRLKQVLGNLISNAVKFTSDGSVRLNVSVNNQDALCFEVRDSGIGIPPEKIATIFEPFRQADGSTTRKYGGTGLGLTICERLAQGMGGHITVQSVPGVGSSFTLHLPLVQPHSGEQVQIATKAVS